MSGARNRRHRDSRGEEGGRCPRGGARPRPGRRKNRLHKRPRAAGQVRNRVCPPPREEGSHLRAGARNGQGRLLLRHDDGAHGRRKRNGLGGRPHDGSHDCPLVPNHQDEAGDLDRLFRFPHAHGRPRPRLRRLRGQYKSDPRAAGEHRRLVGQDRRGVRGGPEGGHALLLHGGFRQRPRRRRGRRSDSSCTRAQTRPPH